MIGLLATAGYGTKRPNWEWELPGILVVNRRAVIVDVRLHPTCSWSAVWQRDTLQETFGRSYVWKGDLLGNLHHRHPELGMKLARPEEGIDWVIRWLLRGWTMILLCGCIDEERCHRTLIHDQVKARLGNRLPEFWPGERVITPDGPGIVSIHVPLQVQRARNFYTVFLEERCSTHAYRPGQLTICAAGHTEQSGSYPQREKHA